jgi:hypothetical protein
VSSNAKKYGCEVKDYYGLAGNGSNFYSEAFLPNGDYNFGVSGPYYQSFRRYVSCYAESGNSDSSFVAVYVTPQVINGVCATPPNGGSFSSAPTASCDKGTATTATTTVPVCGSLNECTNVVGAVWSCPDGGYDYDDMDCYDGCPTYTECTTDSSKAQWRWDCQGGGGGSSEHCYAGLSGPTVTFSASATSIPYGGSTTLSWTPTNSTSCTASGGWSGDVASSGTGNTSVRSGLTSTTTFTIECKNTAGVSTGPQSIKVTVSPAPSVTVSISQNPVPYGGNPGFTLTPSNATGGTCYIQTYSYPSKTYKYLTDGTDIYLPATTGTYYNGAYTTAGSYLYRAYCYNSVSSGSGWTSWKSFTVDLPLQLCRNIGGTYANIATQGGSARFGLLIPGESSATFKTYLNSANNCSGTDVTAGTTFTDTSSNVVTVTGSNPKTVTATMDISPAGQQSGTERIVVSRSGVNIDVDADVVENCVWDCRLTEKDHCSNQPPYKVIDSCKIERSCGGKRYCDYNWKEVAP